MDSTLEFDEEYTYLPLEGADHFLGQLVEVPFGRGNSLRRAIISNEDNQSKFKQIKRIAKVLIQEPVYLPDQIELAKEMKRRYFCSIGQALKTISPPTVFGVGRRSARACRLVDRITAEDMLGEDLLSSLQQQRVVEMLLQVETAFVQEITQACQVTPSVLKTLEKKGIIKIFNKKTDRKLEQPEIWPEAEVEHLNRDQMNAVQGILDLALDKSTYKIQQIVTGRTNAESDIGSNTKVSTKLNTAANSTKKFTVQQDPKFPKLKEALLFGITGSGKTEVYLRISEQIIKHGKTVIILVPEISLTPLMISRFTKKFGDNIAVLHSRLSATQRYEQWQRILRQDKKIVVGARSAIFAPLKNIGLIIIDEEQENSYCSESTPRYNAHEIARIRAIQHNALLLLGSATPAVETFYRSQIGKSVRFELPQRAKPAALPKVHLCQMKYEIARPDFDGVFSKKLINNLQATFADGGQAMLFLNRRGLTSALQCKICGFVVKCDNCEVPMTRHLNQYYKSKDRLICHYCGKIIPVITTCPLCGSSTMESSGLGTQRVEQAFEKLFPEYKALRMDFDTTIGTDTHQRILSEFGRQKADCLIGTQMIAKGHDFPNVRTVGILAVDSMLNTGNFKSEERAFQLITQAAGRSGRSEIQGDVFIQGYDLNNFVIQSAAEQDYASFYEAEIEFRMRAKFAPFGNIGLALFQGLNETNVKAEAEAMYHYLQNIIRANNHFFSNTMVYTAAPAPIPRLRRKYRYRLIVKSDKIIKIAQLFSLESRRKKSKGVNRSLDINPEHML
ncbi:MAG TPA: primosomal protein N' [Clostridiaceae bacterium]|nr:primosomal protein N' [Clostridiaceae bacterium]